MLQHSHTIFALLAAMFVVTCLSESLTIGSVHTDGRILTECDLVKRVSLVCYQCAKRHEEDFLLVYDSCCGDPANEFRRYCNDIFTEAPTRGG